MKSNEISAIPEYISFLEDIKARIQLARIQTARVIYKGVSQLYWTIGEQIVLSQKEHQWGESIVEQLSYDLMKTYPGKTGFSSRNLWFMRQLYIEYADHPILKQLVSEIPWGQNIVIMRYVDGEEARTYYIKATLEMGWSRDVLLNQIKAQAFERHRLIEKQHNFKQALPKHLAEQADLALKDSYMLDFLGIQKPILEAELENKMISKIPGVILELGYGFSFIGNQYSIKANNTEYFIDLLFYNRRLKSLVAVELKIGKFKPEHAGKMNFYLNLLDDFVREPDENPSIGIILCSERDRFEVEYALRGLNSPVGVSQYQLTKILPKELKDKLPNVANLERELMRELREIKNEEKAYIKENV